MIAQVEDLRATASSVQTEGTREATVGGKLRIGLGSLLGRLGLPSADVHAEVAGKRGRKVTEKVEFTRSIEATYRSVLGHLAARGHLHRDPYEAWCAARASARNAFCEVEVDLVPVGWTPYGDAWRTFANGQGTLVLQDVQDPNLKVGMGLPKLVGLGRNGVISETCHLAMRFRPGKARIRVFGTMDVGKYVKPFLATYV
ncbi:hypothetical protein LPC08_25345 (plasmid) [Roseomonas sp. OT10]|uniref:hypothetical protein n=1 Tax=Roseomonas cutis TaxID=2897332 RepID=UPI001E2BF2F4|nr:hypothetical protein [Roseomonas sp. OT10]UFN51592.1 hypothetical protein LPC08_25345 [Roseomonas sp. OT10]